MFEKIVTAYRIKMIPCLLFFATCVMIAPFTGGAEEVAWLVPPAFEGEELQKVREWEKIWVGKTVGRSDLDQVKEFVPEGVYEVMTNATKWGDYDCSFRVVPYQTYKPTSGLIEATHKYSPLAKFDDDDIMIDYHKMAGVPFPKPKTGREVVWNYFTWSRGDDYIRWKTQGSPIDARTKVERGAVNTHWTSYYVNRVDKPPLPNVPKNRRKIRKARFMRMLAPTSMTDFTSLSIQYIDLKKEFDGWMYWPRFRKITRIQTDVRDDVYDGLDWIQDDFPDGFDDNPQKFNYKLVGRKTLLLSRNTDTHEYGRELGMVLFRGLQRELINTYVVEVTKKTAGYVYARQLWFIDPETWAILFKTIYNRQGKFWKFMGVYTQMREVYGAQLALPEAYLLVDLIRRHGTADYFPNPTDIETEWSRNRTFSIRNMDRRSY